VHQSDLLQLYDYNEWANERLLTAAARASLEQLIAPQTLSGGSLLYTLVHTMTPVEGYRVKCETGVQMAVFADERMEDFPNLEAVRNYWVEVNQAMQDYLRRLTDDELNHSVFYRNRDGSSHERVLWQPLLHVLVHSTQHRAEVAEALTLLGFSPGDLDFEIYLREQVADVVGE
jgi:uncharacterized damage-inducible protein DinB